jgi:hypothetical protein
VLTGRFPKSPAQLVEEQRMLEPDAVVRVFRQLRDSMLLLAPIGSERPQRHFEPYPGPRIEAIAPGRTFPLVGKASRNPLARTPVPTLSVSSTGAVVRDASGSAVAAVPWAEAVAVLSHADGTRVLLAQDGYQVAINPREWKDGRSAVSLVDLLAPAGLVVPMSF